MTKDQQVVFAVGDSDDGPVLLFGIPEGAWEFMKDGLTHQFDLTQIGIPLKVMMFGAKDHQSAMDMLALGAQISNMPTEKRFDIDFSIERKDDDTNS